MRRPGPLSIQLALQFRNAGIDFSGALIQNPACLRKRRSFKKYVLEPWHKIGVPV